MVANFWHQEFAATAGQATTEGWKTYVLEFFAKQTLF